MFHSNCVIGSPEMQVPTRVQCGVMVITDGAIMPGSNPMLKPKEQSSLLLVLSPDVTAYTTQKCALGTSHFFVVVLFVG